MIEVIFRRTNIAQEICCYGLTVNGVIFYNCIPILYGKYYYHFVFSVLQEHNRNQNQIDNDKTNKSTITGLEVRGRYRALSIKVFLLGKHGIRRVLHFSDVLMIEILYHNELKYVLSLKQTSH